MPAGETNEEAMRNAAVKIEAEYRIPIEHHNPMEPHAAIALWQDGKLTIFDKTQDVYGVRAHLAARFGIPEENINVISPFVGGAFGSSLRPNYYPSLTAMAARELKRPVKLVYTRTHMYSGHGYRPYTIQKVALGSDSAGKLASMIHEAVHNTSSFEEFNDGTTNFPRQVYACPNLSAPLPAARPPRCARDTFPGLLHQLRHLRHIAPNPRPSVMSIVATA